MECKARASADPHVIRGNRLQGRRCSRPVVSRSPALGTSGVGGRGRGSLIGAGVLQTLGESHSSYLVLFGLSSLVRLFTVPLLWRSPVRAVEVVQPAVRVVAVRPDDGGHEAPILPSLAESK